MKRVSVRSYQESDGPKYRVGLKKNINKGRKGRFTCALTGPICERSSEK